MRLVKHPQAVPGPDPLNALLPRENAATLPAETQTLKILSDPTRLGLLENLAHGEQCVSALTERMGLRQPRISHHLGILRRAGLVQHRRAGKNVYYRLSDRWCTDSASPRLDLGSLRLQFNA